MPTYPEYADWNRVVLACKHSGVSIPDCKTWASRGASYVEGEVERVYASAGNPSNAAGAGTIRALGKAAGVEALCWRNRASKPSARERIRRLSGEALGGRSPSYADLEWQEASRGGFLQSSPTNALKALDAIGRADRYRLNTWSGRIELLAAAPGVVGEPIDADDEILTGQLASETALTFTPTPDAMLRGITLAARDRSYNPITEWLESLRWDGVDRLSGAARYFGAADTPLQNAYARLIFGGMASRALQPGIAFAYMPILQGRQGVGKSTAIEILATDARYVEEGLEFGLPQWRRTLQERVETAWALEIAEIQQLGGAGMAAAKSLITDKQLNNRLAYGRGATRMKLHTVLFGTTNVTAFLSDTTGLRRFPVIVCENPLPLGELRRDLPQLYAQAIAEWRAGGCAPVRLPKELWAAADEASEQFQLVGDFYTWAEEYLEYIDEITQKSLDDAWGADHKFRVSTHEKAAALTALGFTRRRLRRQRVWVRDERAPEPAPPEPQAPPPSAPPADCATPDCAKAAVVNGQCADCLARAQSERQAAAIAAQPAAAPTQNYTGAPLAHACADCGATTGITLPSNGLRHCVDKRACADRVNAAGEAAI